MPLGFLDNRLNWFRWEAMALVVLSHCFIASRYSPPLLWAQIESPLPVLALVYVLLCLLLSEQTDGVFFCFFFLSFVMLVEIGGFLLA